MPKPPPASADRLIRPGADWKPGDVDFTDVALRDRRARGRPGREDHDRPARGPQRVPTADAVRAPGRLRARPRRPDGRGDRADRPGAGGVLLGRRPAHPRRRRLRRRRRHRPAQRARPPGADPPAPEAGRRDGRGVRDRRRPRAARRVRPHDRGRQRPLRPDGPQGRLLRRRIRLRPARAHGGAEEGARDLVPLRAVRRRRGRAHGPRQHGRAARGPRGRDRRVVRDGCSSTARSRCAC